VAARRDLHSSPKRLEKIAHKNIIISGDIFPVNLFDGGREHPRIEKPKIYFAEFIKQVAVIFDPGFEVVEEVGLALGAGPLLLTEMVYDSSSEMKVVNVVKAADAMTRQSWSEMRSERKAVAARLAFIIAVSLDRGVLQTRGAFHKRSNRL
jgi:hypothetical protein